MYEGAAVFKDDYSMRKDEEPDPMVVCNVDEGIELSEDEKQVLLLGPKFCILNKLSEETFQREVEEMIIKYRWEMRDQGLKDGEMKKFCEDAYYAIESLFTEEERHPG